MMKYTLAIALFFSLSSMAIAADEEPDEFRAFTSNGWDKGYYVFNKENCISMEKTNKGRDVCVPMYEDTTPEKICGGYYFFTLASQLNHIKDDLKGASEIILKVIEPYPDDIFNPKFTYLCTLKATGLGLTPVASSSTSSIKETDEALAPQEKQPVNELE